MTSAPSTFSAYRMIERETVNRNYSAGEQHVTKTEQKEN
jgi:hypothetical protein